MAVPPSDLRYYGVGVDLIKADKPSDIINLPPHYARWKLQPLEFIAVNGLDFVSGNVIKYVMRHDAKNGVEDLRKARAYLDMLIRKAEGVERWWESNGR